MSRVYKLTKLGKSEVVRGGVRGDEGKVMNFLYGNDNRATEEELDFVAEGGRFIARKLRDQGLVQELTTGDGL